MKSEGDGDALQSLGMQQYLLEIGETHGCQYNVKDISRVERQDELERQNSKYSDVPSDRRLIWHGSRATNYGGILSKAHGSCLQKSILHD